MLSEFEELHKTAYYGLRSCLNFIKLEKKKTSPLSHFKTQNICLFPLVDFEHVHKLILHVTL